MHEDARMKIRPAGIADVAAVATVHVRTWQQCYRGIVPDDYLDGLSIQRREEQWREVLASGTTEVWVAESSTGVVGWIAFDASRDPDAEPSTGELQAVYVSPERWSSGIGRELWLKHALDSRSGVRTRNPLGASGQCPGDSLLPRSGLWAFAPETDYDRREGVDRGPLRGGARVR
jgi:ribosomal protein S18 acetylase RimI-like enzyme